MANDDVAIHAQCDKAKQQQRCCAQQAGPLRGEINSEVHDTGKVLESLKAKFKGTGKFIELDGISFEFPAWWFNVRASNTEPLIRLNLEAKTKAMMEKHRDDVFSVIRG